MHICLAIDRSFVGGGHLHALSIAKAVAADGHRVTLLNSEPGPFSELAEENGISVRFVPMGKMPSLRRRTAWRRVISELSPDILHLQGAVAGFWGRFSADKNRRYRIFYTVHGIQFIHRRNLLARFFLWLSEIMMRDRANRILCVSQSDARDALRLRIARKEQIRIISNGISMAPAIAGTFNLASWGVPADAFVVGCVGRLTPVKGQRYAIDAVRLLADRCPKLHLVLIGIGEEERSLRDLAIKEGIADRVHFAGFVKNPVEALAMLRIHLLPSLWEGQGIVLMEAMLAGTPSIASAVNGIPEVVRDGEEALLVPPKDAIKLAEAIEKLMNDQPLRLRMSEKGRERAKLFDQNRTVRMTLDLYEPKI